MVFFKTPIFRILFSLGLGMQRYGLARIFHELVSRDHKDGRATRQPQGVGSEAYLNGTPQGEPVLSEVEGTPEDARKDAHIPGRSK